MPTKVRFAELRMGDASFKSRGLFVILSLFHTMLLSSHLSKNQGEGLSPLSTQHQGLQHRVPNGRLISSALHNSLTEPCHHLLPPGAVTYGWTAQCFQWDGMVPAQMPSLLLPHHAEVTSLLSPAITHRHLSAPADTCHCSSSPAPTHSLPAPSTTSQLLPTPFPPVPIPAVCWAQRSMT